MTGYFPPALTPAAASPIGEYGELSRGTGMAMVVRTSLLVLLTWRLLLPPGVCLCQFIHPAASLLARLLGNEPPAPEPEEEGHLAGCPASKLGPGLRAQPADPPAPPAPAFDSPALAGGSPTPSAALTPLPDHAVSPGTAPLYVILCAFLL
jgi:hypothetical protein